MHLSLSMVLFNSSKRRRQTMAYGIFALLKTTLQEALAKNTSLNTFILL